MLLANYSESTYPVESSQIPLVKKIIFEEFVTDMAVKIAEKDFLGLWLVDFCSRLVCRIVTDQLGRLMVCSFSANPFISRYKL